MTLPEDLLAAIPPEGLPVRQVAATLGLEDDQAALLVLSALGEGVVRWRNGILTAARRGGAGRRSDQ